MVEIIAKKGEIKRIRTFVKGLDEAMEGGIPVGHVNLISGTAGTMKSSVCFNIGYNEALNGNVAIYLSLEQPYESLLNHIINMGFDLSKINILKIDFNMASIKKAVADIKKAKSGAFIIADISSLRKELKGTKAQESDWWNLINNVLSAIRKELPYTAFILDSLDALYTVSNFEDARTKLFYIFEQLKALDTTSFLISEMPLDRSRYSKYEIEDFLSDGVIMIRLIERYRKVTREIAIVKMRATNCNNDVYTLEYVPGTGFRAMYGGKPPLV